MFAYNVEILVNETALFTLRNTFDNELIAVESAVQACLALPAHRSDVTLTRVELAEEEITSEHIEEHRPSQATPAEDVQNSKAILTARIWIEGYPAGAKIYTVPIKVATQNVLEYYPVSKGYGRRVSRSFEVIYWELGILECNDVQIESGRLFIAFSS